MSRSNPNEQLVNPSSKFFEWGGKSGQFSYWDRTLKQNVDIPLPFTFIPLDKCVTLKGYNKKKDKGFWSNEVKNIQKDKFIVRSKDGIEFEGLYKDLKDQLELNKINYIESLYIAYKEGNKLVLGNIQIKTSALKPWIEFSKANKVMEIAVTVKKTTKEINGDVEFVSPIYEAVKIKEETNLEAIELDKVLQEYLKAYFERNATTHTETAPIINNSLIIGETAGQPLTNKSGKSDVSTSNIENATIISTTDFSDLPF